ncbi:MAG: DUF664 domain-containing protein [Thermomicrobiales bacterium]
MDAKAEHTSSNQVEPNFLNDQGRFINLEGRAEPSVAGDDAATLLGFLERQRATFAWKCSGLDASGLGQSLAPSSITPGGMLKHLARFEDDMSSEWLAGNGQLPPWDKVDWNNDHDWDWRSAVKDSPAELYCQWQQAVNRCRLLFAEALSTGHPGSSAGCLADDQGNSASVRSILLNMNEEYARHNGQADLIRESFDGLTGQDPPH